MSQPKENKEDPAKDATGDNKDLCPPTPKPKEPELSPELQRLQELLKADMQEMLIKPLED